MAHFSNASEGGLYEAQYCNHCINERADGDGCTVWLAHLLYNGTTHAEVQAVLDVLIPQRADGLGNEAFTMFVAVAEQ